MKSMPSVTKLIRRKVFITTNELRDPSSDIVKKIVIRS